MRAPSDHSCKAMPAFVGHCPWSRVPVYTDLALAGADLSALSSVAIDETSYRRGHSYLTLVADADARKVVFVSKGRGADNIAGFVQHLRAHSGAPDNIAAACIDMSPAFIKGVTDHLPKATITFDKFHVVAHASQAVHEMRRTARAWLSRDNCAISSTVGKSTSFP